MDVTERRRAADALRAIKRGGEGWLSLSDAVLGRPAPRDEVVARLADLIDPGEDTTVSAYDLLPKEEREALRWVHGHGGLDSVKKLLDWVVGHCSTKQQLDFDFWLSGRVMHELGFDEDMADREEVERRLLARLMPPGFEWTDAFAEAVDFMDCVHDLLYTIDGGEHTSKEMLAEMVKRLMPEGCEWPRCDNGELVYFGDEVDRSGDVLVVSAICLYCDGSYALNFKSYLKGERVKLHEEVLAGDGEPLREGETVWEMDAKTGTPLTVVDVSSNLVRCEYTWKDGKTYRPFCPPSALTHERPESKCRDCQYWQKDPTADSMGVCWFFYHEYEGEDCYAARRADIGACEEFMPRAKALAERGE